jgi:hypothetical protein
MYWEQRLYVSVLAQISNKTLETDTERQSRQHSNEVEPFVYVRISFRTILLLAFRFTKVADVLK